MDGTSEKTEKAKQEILDSLTEEERQAIIDAIEKDPTIAERLGIELKDEQ